jgi:hypothetical protein
MRMPGRGRPRRIAWNAALILLLLEMPLSAQEELQWRPPRLDASSTFMVEERVEESIAPPASVPAQTEPLATYTLPPATYEPLPPSVLPHDVVTSSGPPSEGWDPLGYFFMHADDTLPAIEEWERSIVPPESVLSPTKPGIFQKFYVAGTWVEGGTDDRAPTVTDISTLATFAVPFPIREWPLLITPGFDARLLDGPHSPDLPANLYDAYLDLTWNLRINRRSSQIFSVAPGYYSDFQGNQSDAFRVTGKWVSTYDIVLHRLTLITGTAYLGRDDIKMLPVGGLLWTPSPWSRFDIVFPNPRAALRLKASEFYEDWLYTGLDFYGGQTWAITRADESHDRLTMLENRVVLGIERRRQGGAGWQLETGWVFDRKVRYRSHRGDDFRPDPTYYVRAGITF